MPFRNSLHIDRHISIHNAGFCGILPLSSSLSSSVMSISILYRHPSVDKLGFWGKAATPLFQLKTSWLLSLYLVLILLLSREMKQQTKWPFRLWNQNFKFKFHSFLNLQHPRRSVAGPHTHALPYGGWRQTVTGRERERVSDLWEFEYWAIPHSLWSCVELFLYLFIYLFCVFSLQQLLFHSFSFSFFLTFLVGWHHHELHTLMLWKYSSPNAKENRIVAFVGWWVLMCVCVCMCVCTSIMMGPEYHLLLH